MPVDPNAAAMAQIQAEIQRALAQMPALQSIPNSGSLGGGMMPPRGTMMAPPQPIPDSGSLPGGMPSPSMMPPLQPIPRSPQTLGIGQPIPMQLPQADPQGQQQGQAPDISYGMSLGDIPSMG